ncbi:class III extradiol dioxygenase subunit B-like domain-containing protein [Micromonospora sp. STR1_7]|uniref:Class III extradiol dioxygenase subunit B-like domain-containing protein n=1 Tax=Micromonospora parastrephiae TaxID=2806101 RepID=A0ABS1Y2B1_9ACTN|nr:class III extradiol dioxygenase subunit B-like domain-containing protein [Micromonospora parastrephiae]MBM0235658.1 class III extradiol dioxygenase subunit B-like domain-containing protein [Micromonospora parastrephiae]
MTGSARRRTGDSRYGGRVPLVAAAVCPHPPLLVPEVAGAAAPELDDLRAACDTAVGRLFAADPDAVVLLGAGPTTGPIQSPATGSLQPWGVDLDVPLLPGQPDRGAVLPLSLTVGAWLLARQGVRAPVSAVQVAADAGPAEVAALAESVNASGVRVALLVLGDGSACRGQKSPGYDDPRAQAYDQRVAAALAGADLDVLLDLDPVVSAELKVAGRLSWQVLAGAARSSGGRWRGELLYDAAPYGVAYFVASWERM